jgi:Cu-Zn family superoxide dismutase
MDLKYKNYYGMENEVMKSNKLWIISLLFLVALVGCSSDQSQPSPSINEEHEELMPVSKQMPTVPPVDIVNAEGEKIGTAALTQEAKGVRMKVNVTNLSPGKHGIHIHEKAFEGVDFQTAGSHLNPYNKQHGLKDPKGPHLGDMPNLTVKPDGTAEQTFFLDGATLIEGKKNSLINRSIIIHEKEDDQKTDPAGNSGDRIAGGIISKNR